MQVLKISSIRHDEVAAIMPVMERAFDPNFGEAWTMEQCRSTMLLPGTSLIVAIDKEEIVAFALSLTVLENSELLLLAVLPQAQNCGIGRKLVDEWTDECTNSNVRNQFLEVRENNKAIKFYENLGFSIIGERAGYYTGSDGLHLSALTMRRCLP